MIRAAVLVATLVLGGLGHACSALGVGPSASAAGEPQEGLEMGKVVLLAPSGPDVTVAVQIARTYDEREKGLMFVKEMAPDDGMLFLFESMQDLKFWMRNTYIPLDMIFIDHSLKVVGVVADCAPLTDTNRDPGAPSQYVLEVNGGFAAKHGIVAGTQVRFEDVANY